MGVTSDEVGVAGAITRQAVAALSVLVLVAGAIGFVVLSPPDATEPSNFHGRTWLSISTASGPQLVLVNGISGLIEGRANPDGPVAPEVRFASTDGNRTVMGSQDAVTVVDSGQHGATSREGISGNRSVLTPEFLLTLGSAAQVLDPNLDGDPREIPGAPEPVEGTSPLLDGQGQAWYLGTDGSEPVAVRVADDAKGVETSTVASDTTELLLIDGTVHAAGESGVDEVEGDGSMPAGSGAGVFPVVATRPDGIWATATGEDLSVFDGSTTTEVRADAPITGLAIWYGTVLVATGDGAAVVRGSELEPLPAISGQPEIHTDGGLLWFTASEEVVAIDRDLNQVPFRLAAIDLDVCVGSCDPDDISRFLEEQKSSTTTTTEPASEGAGTSTTTNPPPRDLRPPAVDPTVPTTTSTTSTTQPPVGDEQREPRPAPPEDSKVTTTSSTDGPAPSTPTGSPTIPGPTTPTLPSPPTLPDGPDLPTPTGPSATTEAPTTAPPPTVPTTTTPPTTAPAPNGLVLQADAGQGFVTAQVGVTGSARSCPGSLGTVTRGTLQWSGAAQGSRDVRIEWPSRDAANSVIQDVTIPDIHGGRVEVRFNACGLTTSRSVDAPSVTPKLSPIGINPEEPQAGSPFNAGVSFDLPGGWSATSAQWSGDGCDKQGDTTIQGNLTFQEFLAPQERCRISVVVTFSPPGGGSPLSVSEEREVISATTTQPATDPNNP